MGQTKTCKFCGSTIDINSSICEVCGEYLFDKKSSNDLCCAKCKAPVSENDHTCPYCGAIFDFAPAEPQQEVIDEKHNIYGIPYNIVIFLLALAASITLTLFASMGKETETSANIIFFSIAFVAAELLLYIYFLPSIVAIEKNNPNIFLIYLCNLLLGVTIVGWFIAFGMALQSKQKA